MGPSGLKKINYFFQYIYVFLETQHLYFGVVVLILEIQYKF
jgi:hypothetical protein